MPGRQRNHNACRACPPTPTSCCSHRPCWLAGGIGCSLHAHNSCRQGKAKQCKSDCRYTAQLLKGVPWMAACTSVQQQITCQSCPCMRAAPHEHRWSLTAVAALFFSCMTCGISETSRTAPLMAKMAPHLHITAQHVGQRSTTCGAGTHLEPMPCGMGSTARGLEKACCTQLSY